MEQAVVIAAIAAFISAIGAVIAVWNYRREILNQRISAAQWKREYFADLLKWSDEAIQLLSESLHLCDLDPQEFPPGRFFDIRHELRIKLSAQIDRGRWFFPNYDRERYGVEKQGAYRGYRPAVLDSLVNAYCGVSSLNHAQAEQNGDRRDSIREAKRLFTSEIQAVLDPRSRDEEFRNILGAVQGA